MAAIVSFGELLVDFVPTMTGVSLAQSQAFQKAPGGAPANVAVGVARLGGTSAFMGKVGDDPFGHFLEDTLRENGVDISSLNFTNDAQTMLAFVSVRADGERDFVFYRHPSADMLFRKDEVDQDAIRQAQILHFGSISLIDEPIRSAVLKAIDTGIAANTTISFDPNLRLNLWDKEKKAREEILNAWPLSNIIKVSEEEVAFIKEKQHIDNIEKAIRSLWHDRLQLVVVTQGAAGCSYFTSDFSGHVAGFPVQSIDTTGAGDAFVSALLNSLAGDFKALVDENRLNEICRFANATAALTTTGRGAISSLPRIQDVEAFLNEHPPRSIDF